MNSEAQRVGSNCDKCAMLRQNWPFLLDHLIEGQDYLLLLSGDLQIIEANDSFAREVGQTAGASFLGTLNDGSRKEVTSFLGEGRLDGKKLELVHPVPAGSRSVEYTFRLSGDCWIAIGRDQSNQIELVSQMSVLISELEKTVAVERQRTWVLGDPSGRDALTGIENRRGVESALAAIDEQYQNTGKGFSILSVDIDHFKQLNDVYGHPAGDKVLQKVALVLKETTRETDCVARVGGEAFMVIASETELPLSLDLAERLRRAVETSKMPDSAGKVTVSIGVSSTQKKVKRTKEELLLLAERALYDAKKSGRNCVRSAE